MPSSTIEDYLLAIYSLDYEQVEVIAARLADKLEVSPPTVSAAVERMVRDGLVDIDSNHSISLTETGFTHAERVARRHRLIERWLSDMLDLDWVSASRGGPSPRALALAIAGAENLGSSQSSGDLSPWKSDSWQCQELVV